MKKIVSLLLAALLLLSLALAEEVVIPEFTIGAKEIPVSEGQTMVDNMKLGYNLGNAFDAYNCNWLTNELDYESAWCGAKTKPELLDALKEAGFRSIRIPISWHNHLSDKENYVISEAWLNRVQEVVDWAMERDLYVIINIHHDNDRISSIPTKPTRNRP